MNTPMRLTRTTRFGICLSASLLFLSACSSDDTSMQAGQQPAKPATTTPKPAAAKPPGTDPTEKMAHAVGNGKPGAAVEIRYEFQSKPEVGKPTQIDVNFVPNAGTDA